jgi:hypothetical protein
MLYSSLASQQHQQMKSALPGKHVVAAQHEAAAAAAGGVRGDRAVQG